MKKSQSILVPGLSKIVTRYQFLLCDIWGVVHNGINAFDSACDALRKFRIEQNGRVALITNAPRPSKVINEQLSNLGVSSNDFDTIVTSGDVTREYLIRSETVNVYHIGPNRDLGLFEGMNINLVDANSAETVVCTGLVDDTKDSPDDYKNILKHLAEKKLNFICANPDVVVERGDKLIWCAGALAQLYTKLGGQVEMLGKPHKPIYDLALEKLGKLNGSPVSKKSVLAIGDGLPTDIKGANSQEIDVLFITGGIHSADFGGPDSPDESKIIDRLKKEKFTVTAAMPKLVW